MSVARVVKITAASPTSFQDAVHNGIERASKTLRGITGLHVIEQNALVADGKVSQYLVNMEVTFVIDVEWGSGGQG